MGDAGGRLPDIDAERANIKEAASYIRSRLAGARAGCEGAGAAGGRAEGAGDGAAGAWAGGEDAAGARAGGAMASGDGARTCGDGAAGARIACDGAAGGRAEGAAGDIPDIAVVLGSGLGGFAGRLADAATIPYADIPRFARSTAPGHKGNLIVGKIAGGPRVICMQGRFHMYEGYAAPEATRHVRVLRELGVSRLILTNASGGLNPAWSAGDLMLIEDHINFTGQNPLTGPNFSEYGPRFPDMSFAYDPGLRETVRRAAGSLSIPLREGVYVGFLGPSFETPAEIRMFQALGASAVGMSTVPEAIVANHCGMKVCGISCVTNLAAGILAQPLTSEEVLESAAKAGPLFEALLEETLRLLR